MQYVYTMIGVSKVVPPKREIIKDISLSFFPGATIGLLGLNGSGKSTVLRIMAGVDKDFVGEARPQPELKVGYLPQEPELDPNKTVRECVEEGVSEILHAQQRLDEKRARATRAQPPREPCLLGPTLTPNGDETAGIDVRELIGRLVPKAKTARWYSDGDARSPSESAAPAPPCPGTADRENARHQREPARRPGGKHENAPEVDAAPSDEDGSYPHVPAGEYEARLVRAVPRQMWNRWVWICWWLVVEGDHAGVELPMYLPRPPKDRESRLSRGWVMTAAYAVATGRRPPRNLGRRLGR